MSGLGRLASAAAMLTVALASTAASAQQRNLEVVQLQVPGQPAQRLYGESHALVIGASNYRGGWSRLPGVPGDVVAVSRLLRQQGFNSVKELPDPSYAQLDAALREFITERGGRADARLLIYFAGHGHTLTTAAGNKIGYIVPVDAPRPERPQFRALAYSMQQVEALARQTEAKHVLFLFDSCFSGTIFRTRAGVPDSISLRTTQPVRQFITAGDENQPVPDESVFRRQLEEGLGQGAADLNGDGYITGSELGMFLEDRVTNYTRQTQTPRYGKIQDPNLDKGDVVFVNPFGRVPSTPPPPPPPPQAGDVVKDCTDCPELVLVPPGSFEMGSPAGEQGQDDDEGPVHTVRIPRMLAVGRYELTRREFARFAAATGYTTEAERNVGAQGCRAWDASDGKWDWRAGRSWKNPGWAQQDNEPVVCVSWNDTQAYLQWLNGRVPGKGYRLLSEAEWEYVARAGSRTRYPWGDDAQSRQQCAFANGTDETQGPGGQSWGDKSACKDGHWFTAPAGSYRPNAFGLYDMHGNAWEWVQDVWHAQYNGAPADGSAWLQGGDPSQRVLRGGSWGSIPRWLRSAVRGSFTPVIRNSITGFRVARTF